MARPTQPAGRGSKPEDPVVAFLTGLIAAYPAHHDDDLAGLAPKVEALLKAHPVTDRDLSKLPSEQADELMDEAYEAEGLRGVPLAVDALRLTPWAYEPWAYLATSFGHEPSLAAMLASLGVYAAERSLKPGMMEQYRGRFWETAETRQVLESLMLAASMLIDSGRIVEAYHRLDDMMVLDEQDHLGARHWLLPLTIEVHDIDYAEHLVETWDDDDTDEAWPYLRAMTEYARWGNSPQGRELAQEAYRKYPLVAKYLLNPGMEPKHTPDERTPEEKAWEAADLIRDCFRRYGGATNWLSEATGERATFSPLRAAKAATKPRRRRRH
ncbi:MAG: hypothetical protein IT302_09570 [Dehalococcoidia bacterium]|nr:hypothetical protein [Dehalococcoidia bacterium]